MPRITAEEFERQYAERSGITVERLRELGRIVAPCHCGEDMCQGWQSTTPERLAEELAVREVIRLPYHCGDCGVRLMGGATVHKPDCPWRELIDEHFPPIQYSAKIQS